MFYGYGLQGRAEPAVGSGVGRTPSLPARAGNDQPCDGTMRLKTALWVAAYLRRCQVEGIFAVVRRRGAEEAGTVFVRISRLDGTSDLFGPAPQSAFDASTGGDRAFSASFAEQPAPDAAVEAYLAREIKFDPDVWIVEVEDRAGRNFLDIVVD
jgi:hypothetical protein